VTAADGVAAGEEPGREVPGDGEEEEAAVGAMTTLEQVTGWMAEWWHGNPFWGDRASAESCRQ